MKRRLTGMLLGTCLLLPALPALAADDVLSLDDALRATQERALTVQTSRARVAGLEAQRHVVGAAQWPSLTLGAGANYRGLFNGLPQQNLDNTTGFPLIQAQGPGVDTSLSAAQLLFDQSATAHAVANASDQVAIAQQAVAQAEQLALETTAVAYVDVLRAQSLQAVATDAVSQARTQLRFGEMRLKAGAGTRADVLQLSARLAQTEDALLQARNAVAIARLILANAMNRPLPEAQALEAISLSPLPTLQPADIAAGIARRPDVQGQRVRLDVAARQVQIEQAGFWPTANAIARATQRNLQQAGVQAGLELSWPVYDGSRARQRTAAAEHNLAAEQVLAEATRQAAELEIRTADLRRGEAQARQATGSRAVSAAEEAYRIVVRRFELGLATVVETAAAQTVLIQARQERVRAAHDLTTADLRLRRALGAPFAGPTTRR
jgi:HAE1 family hydrophobic/amphiphilic exporter-1